MSQQPIDQAYHLLAQIAARAATLETLALNLQRTPDPPGQPAPNQRDLYRIALVITNDLCEALVPPTAPLGAEAR